MQYKEGAFSPQWNEYRVTVSSSFTNKVWLTSLLSPPSSDTSALLCCCYVASVVSDSVQPHRWQPTRLPRPWDSPGKNTGVGCHFLLQCLEVKSESEVAQSCPTLRDPMDHSPPGSSIHGIFQARVLEWGAIAFSVALLYYSNPPYGCETLSGILQMNILILMIFWLLILIQAKYY